jgi:hypothetical protein
MLQAPSDCLHSPASSGRLHPAETAAATLHHIVVVEYGKSSCLPCDRGRHAR